MPEADRIDALIECARRLYERGYTVGLDGNLSTRLADGRILATRSGTHKGMLTRRDILTHAPTGEVLDGDGDPTSELPLHLACYRARPDANAVLHAHPPHAVAATLAGISLVEPMLPEAIISLGAIPTLPYTQTGTDDLARQVEGAVWRHPAVMLERHGAVTIGADLLDAFCNLETLEHTARILLLAHAAGKPRALDANEVDRLLAIGRKRRRV